MLALCAIVPVVIALLLLTPRFRCSSGGALSAALAAAVLIGALLWQMPPRQLAAVTVYGALKSLDIIMIVYGAVLLLDVLRRSGAMRTIGGTFARFSPDRRIQAIVIGWFFSNFLEGAAGFGAAPVLAGSLLVGLGFPVLPALSFVLICNTLAVPFGAVGTPVLTLSATIAPKLQALGMDPSLFHREMLFRLTSISALSGMWLPLLATGVMILAAGGGGRWRAIAEILPFALFSGIVFVVPWHLSALWFGVELPSILGTAVSLPLVLAVLKLGWLTPKRVWDFPRGAASGSPCAAPGSDGGAEGGGEMSMLKAWSPYLAIALLLVLTRLPFLPLKPLLAAALPVRFASVFGVPGTEFRWSPLVNPGVFPFFAVTLAAARGFGISAGETLRIMLASGKRMRQSALAIAASFAMVQIMIFSSENPAGLPGMLTAVAQAAADLTGRGYFAVAPLIGFFGTFFSGSCTVSNILFGAIQLNAAHLLGMSETTAVALQNVGGGLGSMIRIAGVVAACAAVDAPGREGRLMLLNCIPAAIMLGLTLAATALLSL